MDRDSIDKKYQWDLSKIYENIDEFRKDIIFFFKFIIFIEG